MNKFTLQALALTGILAVSGLPTFAADMSPASPAPNASVSTDSKAHGGTSIDKTKNSAAKHAGKSKSMADKKIDKTSKDAKDKAHKQTAAKPATPAVPPVSGSAGSDAAISAGHGGASSSAGATVQH